MITRVSIQPSAILTTNLAMPTLTKSSQIPHIQPSRTPTTETPTTSTPAQVSRKPSKRPEYPVFLEPSMDNILPSTKIESTETLTYSVNPEQKERQPTNTLRNSVTKVRKPSRLQPTRYQMKNITDDRVIYSIASKVESSVSKATPTTLKPKDIQFVSEEKNIENVKEIVGTVIHELVQNGSTSTLEMKPKEVMKKAFVLVMLIVT